MKRIFQSEKETDLLINAHTQETGLTIAKILNRSVVDWLLPQVSLLHVESKYLLEMEMKGELTQWTIKQSISRGISWLGKYPIENGELLKSIILHFTRNPWEDGKEDIANDNVKEMVKEMENKIKQFEPNYNPYHNYLSNFGGDIVDRWDSLHSDKLAYDILSAIVFIEEPHKPFTWYGAISILKRFELEANARHGVK